MDRDELYAKMAGRKCKPADYQSYDGNNGRVNRCVQLMRQGKIRTGGTLLDVGGGIGDLGYAVRDLFERRIVVDISEKNLEAAESKGNETFRCDVDRVGLDVGHGEGTAQRDSPARWVREDSFVDVVVALDFIEHIVDPENFARECHRVLKPNGEVFINTPNIRFWRHIEHLWHSGKFPHTSGDREVYHGGHLAFFTYRDLCEIFEPAGFSSLPIDLAMSSADEGYQQPPSWALMPLMRAGMKQEEYVRLCLELGCPNLLFKATVTK